jgi:hypothetical protein
VTGPPRPPSRFNEVLILVIAVVVPLAGVVLAILQWSSGDRTFALRILAAVVLGICLYALLFA